MSLNLLTSQARCVSTQTTAYEIGSLQYPPQSHSLLNYLLHVVRYIQGHKTQVGLERDKATTAAPMSFCLGLQ